MSVIYKYIPRFVEAEEKSASFNNSKELLNIEWVKRFSKYHDFYRFSISRDRDNKFTCTHALMAEFYSGYSWYVVGFIYEKNIDNIKNLREWKPKYKSKKKNNKKQ